jgi:glucose-6-phosphate 1-dehydrogenase
MPIYLATGKALHEHFATISVYFKEAQTPLFDRDKRGSSYNSIVFHLQPRSAITVQILAKEPGYKHRLEPVEMHFNYHESFSEQGVDAYSRLLLDAMEGDQRLFTRSDEVEAEWGFIDPIIEGLHAKHLKPQSYKPGSRGPRAAQGRLRSL